MKNKLSTIQTIERQIERLEAEYAATANDLAALEAERAAFAPTLAALQAAAVRNSNAAAALTEAEQAEQRDTALMRAVQRRQAALAVIQADLEAARQDLAAARRAEKEARLKAIYEEAGSVADQLDRDLTNTALWGKLQGLFDEARLLVHDLTGHYPGDPLAAKSELVTLTWRSPVEGLRRRLDGIEFYALGKQPPWGNGDRTSYEAWAGKWEDPPTTLRAALGIRKDA